MDCQWIQTCRHSFCRLLRHRGRCQHRRPRRHLQGASPRLSDPPRLSLIYLVRLQGIPAYVRFYRDYSIADFSFTTLTTLLITYASFRYHSVRAGVCEEISRHPDFMRDMQEMGLNLENCEQWFERAVVAFIVVMLIVIVVRVSTAD